MSNTETRTFKVHPNIIHHTISSQAGTIGKAYLEYVMNAVDSGATRVDIDINSDGFTVKDDGMGFDINDILEFFEVFGFPHDEDDHRTFGKFGMGRAQMWSWASTVWRTGTHMMDVDIKNKGLDYGLHKNLGKVKGCTIIGKFYDTMKPSEVDSSIRELTDLSLYCPIPVYVNGHKTNRSTSDVKWDIETDDAFIKLKETGTLSVYNLGVHVHDYPAYQFGVAGVVVTKVELQVNTARNDVLTAKCPVWKRLRKHLQTTSNERTKRKSRLTDAERENLIDQFRNGELSYDDVETLKLITDTQGKHWPVKKLSSISEVTLAPEEGSRIAERVQQRKLCFVLSPKTIERFGCENLEEFCAKLHDLSLRQGYRYHRINITAVDFDSFRALMNDGYEVIEDKDLTQQERWVLQAIRDTQGEIAARCAVYRDDYNGQAWQHRRNIRAGVSDVAAAWTDGNEYIVFDRKMLKLANDGYRGFFKLATLLTHEYCHDTADTGSHSHELDFFEKYHDITQDLTTNPVGNTVINMMKGYLKRLRQNGKKVNMKQLNSEDLSAELEMYEPIPADAA